VSDDLVDRLRRLAAFRPRFEDPDQALYDWDLPQEPAGDEVALEHVVYADPVQELHRLIYEDGWIDRDVAWSAWAHSEGGQRFFGPDPEIDAADEVDLARMLTALFRQERFLEGALAHAIDAGVLLAVLRRAERLADELAASDRSSTLDDPRDHATREHDRDVWADMLGATSPDAFMSASASMHPSELVAMHLLLLASSGPDAQLPDAVERFGWRPVGESLERTLLYESERGRRIARAIREDLSPRARELARRREAFRLRRAGREEGGGGER
jgi:hypothetical protein